MRILIFIVGLFLGALMTYFVFGRGELPLPAGASSEIREAITSSAPFSPFVMKLVRPESAEDWQKLQAQRKVDRALDLPALEQQLGVKIAADQIGGVAVYWVTPANLEK